MKSISNLDIPTHLWLKRFSREQLRNIAKEYGVQRGRTAVDAAVNLAHGIGPNGIMVRFEMDLFNPARPNTSNRALTR